MMKKNTDQQPNKIVVVLFTLLNPIIGFLYIAQIKWLFIYLILFFFGGLLQVLYPQHVIFKVLIYVVYLVSFIHALMLGFKSQALNWRRFHVWMKGLFLLACLWGGIRLFLFNYYNQSSVSMLPNYHPHDFIVIKRWGLGYFNPFFSKKYDLKQLQHGQVIVFKYPKDPSIAYVKRVIALPGDRITFFDGNIQLNGHRLDLVKTQTSAESTEYTAFIEKNAHSRYTILRKLAVTLPEYTFMHTCPQYEGRFECIVPQDQIFVMGDNREQSADSRYWGYVPAEYVLGKVIWSKTYE